MSAPLPAGALRCLLERFRVVCTTVPQRTLNPSRLAPRRADASLVSAARSRHILALLRASGTDLSTLTHTHGLPIRYLQALRRGAVGLVPRAVERQLLAALDDLAGTWVDGTGVSRRLQALVAVGWTIPALCDRLHLPRNYVTKLMAGASCNGLTRAEVCLVYDRLWDVPQTGPAAAGARRYAARQGWFVPMAWDDDAIDDPAAVPVVEPEDRPNLLDSVEWLLEQGEALPGNAARVGRLPASIYRPSKRHDRRDLWVRLKDPAAA